MELKKILPLAAVGVLSAATTIGTYQFIQNNKQAKEESTYFKTARNDGQFANMNSLAIGQDFVKASKTAVEAVVTIKNYQRNAGRQRSMDQDLFDFFFGDPFGNAPRKQAPQKDVPEDLPTGLGSGVIISPDGYIITNNHVVEGASKLEVQLADKKTYTATLIGTDPSTDIALIKIDKKGLTYLNFANSDLAEVGQWVLAVGNPLGLNSTVTAGIISAKGRSIDLLRQKSSTPIESFIQTDAVINRGNSGGALVDINGDLVGINSAISSTTGYYQGYGFAVPSNLARKVVEDIKKYGMVQRAFLGVATIDLSDDLMVKQYNKQNQTNVKPGVGLYVLEVTSDSGAKDSGIKKGDILTKVDGNALTDFADLSLSIGRKRPGDVVKVTYVRDGKENTVNVTLKDQMGNTKARDKSELTVMEKLGADFTPLADRDKVYFGINNGVVATDVDSNGLLASIGIGDGYIITDINGKAVNSKKDIEKILKGEKGQVNVRYLDANGRMISRGFKMP